MHTLALLASRYVANKLSGLYRWINCLTSSNPIPRLAPVITMFLQPLISKMLYFKSQTMTQQEIDKLENASKQSDIAMHKLTFNTK